MSNPNEDLHDEHSTSFIDVKQLGLFASIASLSYVFWVCGGMEMVERLAFYGVKAVAVLYAKDPVSKGGLGVPLAQFGTLLAVWAFVQSFLPILTGGLSDKYGYKLTIFISTILKIMGYIIMALSAIYSRELDWLSGYWGFFVGAVVLAIGTAVFKPGIQGTVVRSTTRRNSSMAWGVFYQTVNIGGYMGPLVAGLMREKMQGLVDQISWLDSGWPLVFIACGLIISLNFILLLTYKEVGKEERLERKRLRKEGKLEEGSLVSESIHELLKPHVWTYLLLFSGFWFMFTALFDVLPAHIDDWVNTRDIIQTLFGDEPSTNKLVNFFVITNAEGTAIQPEGMLNINAGLIMITCFIFAWISSLMRATTSMVVGTLFASVAMFACGYSTAGWVSVGAIAIFSVGEMLSSPKFSEFIGNFAPSDKKAMYLGFSQVPIAIGWTLEGKIGPWLYDVFASKDRFSRQEIETHLGGNPVDLPATEQVAGFAERVGVPVEDLMAMDRFDFVEALTKHAWLPKEEAQTLYDTIAGSSLDSIADPAIVQQLQELAGKVEMPVADLIALPKDDFVSTLSSFEAVPHAIVDEWSRMIGVADGLELARTGLAENLETAIQQSPTDFIEAIPHGEAFDWLVGLTGGDPVVLTENMHAAHHTIGIVWYVLGGIGIISAIGIAIYGKWILTLKSHD